MAFAYRLAEQLARPHGAAGRLLGRVMDFANRKPTRLALDLLDPHAGESILDAGCGTGAAMAQLLRRVPCHVTGLDPSGAMLHAAARRLNHTGRDSSVSLHRSLIEEMPFADGSFDAALALNVLYFSDNEGRMLARLARSVRPGGRIVAYVTHRNSMENWPFARAGIHKLFDRDELFALFRSAGFASACIDVLETPVARSVTGLLALARR